MVIWSILAFGLGVFNFVASYLHFDPLFMQLNGAVYMLIGLGLFIRTYYRKREARIEKLEERVRRLETQAGQSP